VAPAEALSLVEADAGLAAATGAPVNNAVLVQGGGEDAVHGPTAAERGAFDGDVTQLPVCDPAVTQNACRLPTQVQLAASVSGTVWFDVGSDDTLHVVSSDPELELVGQAQPGSAIAHVSCFEHELALQLLLYSERPALHVGAPSLRRVERDRLPEIGRQAPRCAARRKQSRRKRIGGGGSEAEAAVQRGLDGRRLAEPRLQP